MNQNIFMETGPKIIIYALEKIQKQKIRQLNYGFEMWKIIFRAIWKCSDISKETHLNNWIRRLFNSKAAS